jgi:beta-phosphoglucomutase family hydrolase
MKAFIFDMDGVLVDTQYIHSEATVVALHESGVACTQDELLEYAGTKRGVGIAAIIARRHASVDAEAVCVRKDELFMERMKQTKLTAIEGIPALLKNLRAHGVCMAIASSSEDTFISYIVDKLQIRGYFDVLVSGQALPESKPNPEVYLLAAKKLGVRPRDCVVLEDAGLGVQAAKAAGMYCIGYRNPNSGKQDFSLADKIVHYVKEINIEEL